MNEARANRILAALKEQGVDQMLITDPMSICYLTGISMAPIERFYALLLKALQGLFQTHIHFAGIFLCLSK